jgi:hypothetical protein
MWGLLGTVYKLIHFLKENIGNRKKSYIQKGASLRLSEVVTCVECMCVHVYKCLFFAKRKMEL